MVFYNRRAHFLKSLARTFKKPWVELDKHCGAHFLKTGWEFAENCGARLPETVARSHENYGAFQLKIMACSC